ncbi:MAG: D-alanine--D-alanine ligase [Clostridia bacterium]|nr:D-alanine--D-alanine ligase [Clostridia bacterium]
MMKITVLYGGNGDEREVSLRSGSRVAGALRDAGHTVTLIDHQSKRLADASELLRSAREADAVFLALHGGAGEDGTLQKELEAQGIFHYTGSAPRGAAIAMRKDLAKARVAAVGVPVAKGVTLSHKTALPPLPLPLAVKPTAGGSSVGLYFVKTVEEWQKITPCGGILCEEYLPGREYTVGILGGRALPVVEIRPLGGAYDYEHKYTAGASEELCPAPLSPQKAGYLTGLALSAYGALGLRDYARIDFREDEGAEPRFLEANTLPGMTETSLFPLAASAAGISFPQLCEIMATSAAKRKR